jgi:hypothetical protein
MNRWLAGCCVLVVGAAALSFGVDGSARPAAGPCGTARRSTARYTHVIWIVEENQSYGKVIGDPTARYINTLARKCGLATNYHNISHPSLPNYVGMTSGLRLSKLKRFSSDCNPSRTCSTPAPSIFRQTSSWKVYEESMPANCYRNNRGQYAVRHNPAPYFRSLTTCATKDVPYTRLAKDLSRHKLPAFSFVTPNLIHDDTVAESNSWLKRNLPAILHSREYRAGRTAVFITWDEGEGGTSDSCATNATDVGCHVAMIIVSPTTTPGTKSRKLFNHYSLLRTTERLLGLRSLGRAKHANGMKRAFGL